MGEGGPREREAGKFRGKNCAASLEGALAVFAHNKKRKSTWSAGEKRWRKVMH